MKIKDWKNYNLIRNIFKFELFYKLMILFILSPFLRTVVHQYLEAVSNGIAFNQDMIFSFLSWHGILMFLLLSGIMIGIIYYEIYVLIQILTLEKQKESYSLRQVMLKSIVNLRYTPKLSLFISGIYYTLLLPLVHIGYLNSYIMQWNIPPFIFGELKLTFMGQILMILIYVLYYGLYVMMIFVPLYMVLKQYKLSWSIQSSIQLLKRITIKDKVYIALWIVLWMIGEMLIWSILPYQMLHNRDFSFYFLKYFINSTSFRYSALQYIVVVGFYTIMMVIFLRFMISMFMRYEDHFIMIHDMTIEVDNMNKKIVKVKNWIIEFLNELKTSFLQSRLYTKHKKVMQIVLGILSVCLVIGYLHSDALLHEPWVIGHRCSGYKVENSIEALRDANDMNASYAEIDIQLSKDGIPIVFHDSHLSRLSSRNEKISDLTAKELQQVELKQNNSISHIMTLEEMIKMMQDEKMTVGLLIELKPTSTNGREMSQKVVDVVEKYNFSKQAIFMSLDYTAVQELKKLQPSWWIGYCIYGSVGDIDESIWSLNIDFLAVEENRMSTSFIQKAISHMLPIYVWTVDDEKKMNQYLNMGVSGLITNYPDIARQTVDAYEDTHYHHYYYEGRGYPGS